MTWTWYVIVAAGCGVERASEITGYAVSTLKGMRSASYPASPRLRARFTNGFGLDPAWVDAAEAAEDGFFRRTGRSFRWSDNKGNPFASGSPCFREQPALPKHISRRGPRAGVSEDDRRRIRIAARLRSVERAVELLRAEVGL